MGTIMKVTHLIVLFHFFYARPASLTYFFWRICAFLRWWSTKLSFSDHMERTKWGLSGQILKMMSDCPDICPLCCWTKQGLKKYPVKEFRFHLWDSVVGPFSTCTLSGYNLRPPVPVLWLRPDICPPPLIPDFGLMSLKSRVLPYDL